MLLYALIALVAVPPSLAGIFGSSLKPLQVEGLLLTLLVFVGRERRLGLSGGAAELDSAELTAWRYRSGHTAGC